MFLLGFEMTQLTFEGVPPRLTYSLSLRFESWPRLKGIEVKFGRQVYNNIPKVSPDFGHMYGIYTLLLIPPSF